jgi:hypothetical protein
MKLKLLRGREGKQLSSKTCFAGNTDMDQKLPDSYLTAGYWVP